MIIDWAIFQFLKFMYLMYPGLSVLTRSTLEFTRRVGGREFKPRSSYWRVTSRTSNGPTMPSIPPWVGEMVAAST